MARVADPEAQHSAWQARFRAAAAQLSRWRVTVTLHERPLEQRADGAAHGACSSSGSGGGGAVLRAWRCRAADVQRHEQSLWVRYPLPPALAADAGAARAVAEGRAALRVEARAGGDGGGDGWLPLIVSAPFRCGGFGLGVKECLKDLGQLLCLCREPDNRCLC